MNNVQQENKYQSFLQIISESIKERALSAKTDKKSDFNDGRVLGFNEIISIIQQTAQGMNIPLEDIGFDGIDPDKDL